MLRRFQTELVEFLASLRKWFCLTEFYNRITFELLEKSLFDVLDFLNVVCFMFWTSWIICIWCSTIDFERFFGQKRLNLHKHYFTRFQVCEWLNFANVVIQVFRKIWIILVFQIFMSFNLFKRCYTGICVNLNKKIILF